MEGQDDIPKRYAKRKATPESPYEKAHWDAKTTEIFIRTCVQEVRAGNRPNTYFNRKGWQNIVEHFREETGRKYSKGQLKNRWDALKKDWGLWKSMLRGESGLGWDNIKQTVDASDDWWESKLQKFPNGAKFQKRGPILLDKQDMLFIAGYKTGENAGAPNSGNLQLQMQEQECDESNDLFDDIEASIENDVDKQVTSNENKCDGTSKNNGGKPKSAAAGLRESLDRLLTAFELSNVTFNSIKGTCRGCSITECIQILRCLPGLQKGGPLYMYACDLFLKPAYREMFVAQEEDGLRLQWLKKQFGGAQP